MAPSPDVAIESRERSDRRSVASRSDGFPCDRPLAAGFDFTAEECLDARIGGAR